MGTTTPRSKLITAVTATIALALSACSSGSNSRNAVSVDADGTTEIDAGGLADQLDTMPVAVLTPEESANLVWMREEEKLARDVYLALGETWDTKVFDNIADAEQTHTDSVQELLARYGIADPVVGKGAGEFSNPEIQALYDDLVAAGSESLVAALTVGATIEDLDIADLHDRATDTPDIALVYANLERGSRNHMRAFVKQLGRNGASYTPVHISADEFEAIVSTDVERGNGTP